MDRRADELSHWVFECEYSSGEFATYRKLGGTQRRIGQVVGGGISASVIDPFSCPRLSTSVRRISEGEPVETGALSSCLKQGAVTPLEHWIRRLGASRMQLSRTSGSVGATEGNLPAPPGTGSGNVDRAPKLSSRAITATQASLFSCRPPTVRLRRCRPLLHVSPAAEGLAQAELRPPRLSH